MVVDDQTGLSAVDDRLAAALSALRLEALAPALGAAGLSTLAALEDPLMASRTAFLALLKASGVGSLPQRQALANGLTKRRREGDVPVWVRPGDALLCFSPWNWLILPGSTVAVSAAVGAFLRVRWRVGDGGASAAPSLSLDAPAHDPQPMVLTATYRGHPPIRIRVRAGADGVMTLPPPPQPRLAPLASAETPCSAGEADVHDLTLQIESVVQTSDRWGNATDTVPPRPPAPALRVRGVRLPPGAIPTGKPSSTRSFIFGTSGGLAPSNGIGSVPSLPSSPPPLRVLAFGDSITEGVMARARDPNDPEIGDMATTSAGGSWATELARRMGGECSLVSFGRQGWTLPGNGGAPCFVEAWREVWAGTPRFAAVRGSKGARVAAAAAGASAGGASGGSRVAGDPPTAPVPVGHSATSPNAPASVAPFAMNSPSSVGASESPSLVLVNHGTNDALGGASDATVCDAVRAWCWEVRAMLGPAPVVAIVLPFGGFCAAAIRTGFQEYQGEGLDSSGDEECHGAGAVDSEGCKAVVAGVLGESGEGGNSIVERASILGRDPRTVLIALGDEVSEGLRGPAPKGPISIDGVHPNLDTHRRIAEAVHQALLGALSHLMVPLAVSPPALGGAGWAGRGEAEGARGGEGAGAGGDAPVLRVHLFGDSNVNTCLDIGSSAEEEIQEGEEEEMPKGGAGSGRGVRGGVATAPSGLSATKVYSGTDYSGTDYSVPDYSGRGTCSRGASSPGYFCLSHAFLAGSAMGLSNPHSHSGYRDALLSGLRRVRPGDVAALKFGQARLPSPPWYYVPPPRYFKQPRRGKERLCSNLDRRAASSYFTTPSVTNVPPPVIIAAETWKALLSSGLDRRARHSSPPPVLNASQPARAKRVSPFPVFPAGGQRLRFLFKDGGPAEPSIRGSLRRRGPQVFFFFG
jgi:lysophospholipase L1-like esterase